MTEEQMDGQARHDTVRRCPLCGSQQPGSGAFCAACGQFIGLPETPYEPDPWSSEPSAPLGQASRAEPSRRRSRGLAIAAAVVVVAAIALVVLHVHWGVFTSAGNSGVQQNDSQGVPNTTYSPVRDLPDLWIGTGNGSTWLLDWTAHGSSFNGTLSRACGASEHIGGEISAGSVSFTGLGATRVSATISSGDLVFSEAAPTPMTATSSSTFIPGSAVQWKALDTCS